MRRDGTRRLGGNSDDDSLGCDAHPGGFSYSIPSARVQARAAVSLGRWLQKIMFGMGLSKLSSVIWLCVEGAHAERTQSNLLLLNKLSAPGDCEASWGTLEPC